MSLGSDDARKQRANPSPALLTSISSQPPRLLNECCAVFVSTVSFIDILKACSYFLFNASMSDSFAIHEKGFTRVFNSFLKFKLGATFSFQLRCEFFRVTSLINVIIRNFSFPNNGYLWPQNECTNAQKIEGTI